MLLKSDGFVLAELLLSLSVLLIIGLFFTPLYIDVTVQRRQLQIEKQANQLLFEELQGVLINSQDSINHNIMINGTEYQVLWEQSEVCIKIEQNPFNQETIICGYPE